MKSFVLKYKKLLVAAAALLCAAGVLTGALLHRQEVRRQEEAARVEAERRAWEALQQELADAREALSAALQGTWSRAVEEDANTHLELFVTQGAMDYNFRNARYPEYDQTLLTYSWEVVDGTSIMIRYPEGGENLINVTFIPASGDAPERVEFSPAITSMDVSESWERSEP